VHQGQLSAASKERGKGSRAEPGKTESRRCYRCHAIAVRRAFPLGTGNFGHGHKEAACAVEDNAMTIGVHGSQKLQVRLKPPVWWAVLETIGLI
jgi:hypothetical protein